MPILYNLYGDVVLSTSDLSTWMPTIAAGFSALVTYVVVKLTNDISFEKTKFILFRDKEIEYIKQEVAVRRDFLSNVLNEHAKFWGVALNIRSILVKLYAKESHNPKKQFFNYLLLKYFKENKNCDIEFLERYFNEEERDRVRLQDQLLILSGHVNAINSYLSLDEAEHEEFFQHVEEVSSRLFAERDAGKIDDAKLFSEEYEKAQRAYVDFEKRAISKSKEPEKLRTKTVAETLMLPIACLLVGVGFGMILIVIAAEYKVLITP